tara:strand:- start:4131 stop:4376 length:246 start_codon:yes stop_codon:yes gene_type:complete
MGKMIDKKISLGTILTLGTIIGTFIYTQGIIATNIDNNSIDIQSNEKKIMSNRTKTQSLEVGQERIETKIDMMLKIMEEQL